MKNNYLNNVFISRLYPHIIQKNKKQKKNILLIKQRKDEKKKIIEYIKSQYIPFNLLKMKIELQRDYKKKTRCFEMKERKTTDETKEIKKMN